MEQENNKKINDKSLNITELIASLKDKKELVRAEAAFALGELQATEAIPYLENALKVENRKRARLDMYFALCKVGKETDLAPLLHMLKAKPPATRKEAADRLVRLANKGNRQDIKAALEYALVKEEDQELIEELQKGISALSN
ncbi:MAG: HEAT repeat domain-containing protein [Clostridia bacterium]|nr:HEAT repeat domain-containing protein [Clostridia bacterium]